MKKLASTILSLTLLTSLLGASQELDSPQGKYMQKIQGCQMKDQLNEYNEAVDDIYAALERSRVDFGKIVLFEKVFRQEPKNKLQDAKASFEQRRQIAVYNAENRHKDIDGNDMTQMRLAEFKKDIQVNEQAIVNATNSIIPYDTEDTEPMTVKEAYAQAGHQLKIYDSTVKICYLSALVELVEDIQALNSVDSPSVWEQISSYLGLNDDEAN